MEYKKNTKQNIIKQHATYQQCVVFYWSWNDWHVRSITQTNHDMALDTSLTMHAVEIISQVRHRYKHTSGHVGW